MSILLVLFDLDGFGLDTRFCWSFRGFFAGLKPGVPSEDVREITLKRVSMTESCGRRSEGRRGIGSMGLLLRGIDGP
jgi:hypothetical protein